MSGEMQGRVCPSCERRYDEQVVYCPIDGARLTTGGQSGNRRIGAVLGGKYRILRLLGTGGMSEVYEAEHVHIPRRLAVKLLKPEQRHNAEMVARFRREAVIASMIRHENVVAIDDFGATDDGSFYMTMELLEGEALSALMRRRSLPLGEVMDICAQLARGLEAAHAQGIIHRDVKPHNVFVDARADGGYRAKLLDLGIARMEDAVDAQRVTKTGVLVGSPTYMSPEQCKGAPLDARTDIYSLGVILFEMVTGRLPFDADTYRTLLSMHVNATPEPPSRIAPGRGIPNAVDFLVLRALAKEPEQRFANMRAMAAEIEEQRDRLAARPGPDLLKAGSSRGGVGTITGKRFVGDDTRIQMLADAVPVEGAAADFSGPARLAEGVHWIGRHTGDLLECNSYVVCLRGQGSQVCIVVDPGPVQDYATMLRKLSEVIGSPENVDYVFLNHQDPDVAGNAVELTNRSPKAKIICSEDTWRVARYYGLDPKRYLPVERMWGGKLRLPTGHELRFVPTPFCHFRGAVMLYEPLSRVLFSGDLFGGVSVPTLGDAGPARWTGIRLYHQTYMPSPEALRYAVEKVRGLTPPPTLIAPQHGAPIPEAEIDGVLARMETLPVGLESYLASHAPESYLRALGELLPALRRFVTESRVDEALALLQEGSSYPEILEVVDGIVVDFRGDPRTATELLLQLIVSGTPGALRGQALDAIRQTFSTWLVGGTDAVGEGALDFLAQAPDQDVAPG